MSSAPAALARTPKRGEIWEAIPFPSDPPDKFSRRVLIVSIDARNLHPRGTTVLVVPLFTSLSKNPYNIQVQPGETGLGEVCELQPHMISAVRKVDLKFCDGTRTLSDSVIRSLAPGVIRSMGVPYVK